MFKHLKAETLERPPAPLKFLEDCDERNLKGIFILNICQNQRHVRKTRKLCWFHKIQKFPCLYNTLVRWRYISCSPLVFSLSRSYLAGVQPVLGDEGHFLQHRPQPCLCGVSDEVYRLQRNLCHPELLSQKTWEQTLTSTPCIYETFMKRIHHTRSNFVPIDASYTFLIPHLHLLLVL